MNRATLALLAALLLCSGCGRRITGPERVDASDATLAQYVADVQATQADPASWPEGWTR